MLIFANFYWSICWQIAAITMQIIYKHIANFFGANWPKSHLISANNRQFESWMSWTILTSILYTNKDDIKKIAYPPIFGIGLN